MRSSVEILRPPVCFQTRTHRSKMDENQFRSTHTHLASGSCVRSRLSSTSGRLYSRRHLSRIRRTIRRRQTQDVDTGPAYLS